MEDKHIVAIEIGSSKIRGALARLDATGTLNVIAVHEEHIVDSVRYGQVRNVEEVSNRIDSIRRQIEASRAVTNGKVTGVYVGLSGFSVASNTASGSLELGEEREITAEDVAELSELIASQLLSEKDNLQMLPVEFSINNEATMKPVGCVGRTISATYNIIEGAPALRSNINRVLPERLGLEVKKYIVSTTAVADTILSADDKQLGCALVDFGAETTTVAIYKGGVLRSLVTLPMGSRNITRDLTTLNYSFERAEAIKREVGVVNVAGTDGMAPHSIDQQDIANYISARAGEIIANIMARIEYAGFKPADLPNGIIITGGGARLKGFTEMLQNNSGMKVRMGTAPRTIRFSDNSISPDDAIDIIALLNMAVTPVESAMSCITIPEPTPKPDPFEAGRRGGVLSDDDYDDENESRIGLEDDDILDDDDDFDNSKHKHKKPKQPKRPTPPSPDPQRPSIIDKITDRIKKLMRDPEDDGFDDISEFTPSDED